MAQLQELIHFDLGQKPAGVTDRLIDFERLVGECEPSSGDLAGCTSQARRSVGERSARALDTSVADIDYVIMRQTVESFPIAGRSWQTGPARVKGRSTNGNRRRVRRQGRRLERQLLPRAERQRET